PGLETPGDYSSGGKNTTWPYPSLPARHPSQNREHFGCNQRRGSTARVMRELPGLHVRLQRLEILINREIELERRIGTAYLLLHEHGNLLGLSCSRTITHPQSAPCASTFAGICVVGCSVIKVLPNKPSLQVTIHFFQENLMPLVTGSVIQH